MATKEGSSPVVEELAKVARVLSRPALRKSFHTDPVGTLTREGVNVQVIPEKVLDFLSGLSHDELRLLSHLDTTLTDAGLTVQYGDSRVGFF